MEKQMTVDFRLPHLGENIYSADVIKVLLKEGDKVEINQVVVEIETDKATIEVPSDIEGIVKKVFVKEGQKAEVGEPLVEIEVSSSQVVVSSKHEEEKRLELRNQKSEISSKKADVNSEVETTISTGKSQNLKQEQPSTDHRSPTTSFYEFKIPVLGENILSASVSKVLVKNGDKVEADQIVLEIETDKATVEIPTEVSGVVKNVKINDSDKVSVGQVAFIIESTDSASKQIKFEEQKHVREEQQLKADSRSLTADQQISLPSEVDLTHHIPKVISVPKNISKIVVPAAPSVRRFAREIGVDINQITGTNAGGRISIEDVKAFAKKVNEQYRQSGFTGNTIGITKEILPDFSKWGEIDRQPMSNIRRKTAEHLSYAWATISHVTQFDKADITELENLRKQFGKKVDEAGGKLTVTAILLKVIGSALKVFPQFNTSVDMDKNEIIYKKFVNVGVAVDTDRGLLVPVIRNVDEKNIIQLSIELQEMSKKAREKKLSLEEMQGGCFTISNLGGIGGTYFTPIVNSPEVAILGVSRSSYEPVFINNNFEPRLMMPLSLSYDHRIIDGADGIRFLRWVVNALENPFLLSLEG